MKATAHANANIALVKYWGKRDPQLNLPQNSSVSMTCDGLSTVTTVEFSPNCPKDRAVLNGAAAQEDELHRISAHLDLIRKRANIDEKARVLSKSDFPASAGLASSSSGFAALTLSAASAAGLRLAERELTILARQGSGSASRSICEGFAEWHKGEKKDGSDCYAESIAPKAHWPEFRMLAAVVSNERKKTGSRAGMLLGGTSPYYMQWCTSAEADAVRMKDAIQKRDFAAVGALAEHNCLKMHAIMQTTEPPLLYWEPATISVMREVISLREEGLHCYFTIDAGPQVKVLCMGKSEKKIGNRLRAAGAVGIISCRPGDGARLIEKHLF